MARAWAGRVGRSGIAFEQRRAMRRRTRHEERGMARVAIVTGGNRGIGEAISRALKEADMTVAANYAGNDERAKAFTDRTSIKAYKWDVGDFDACQKGCQQVADELGPVDVVVNNAGSTRDGTMPKMTYEMWDGVMRTKIGGAHV